MNGRKMGLLLSILAALAPAAGPAPAADRGGCYPKGSTTVVRGAEARVFLRPSPRGRQTYGCLLEERRPYLLAARALDKRNVRLARQHVGYVIPAMRSADSVVIRRFDLAAGEGNRVARYRDSRFHIESLGVNDRGSIAWIVNFDIAAGTIDDSLSVHRLDDRGEVLLDSSAGDGKYRIDPLSLLLRNRGRTIHWTGVRCVEFQQDCAQEPHTADLH